MFCSVEIYNTNFLSLGFTFELIDKLQSFTTN